jgi:hypothetical protein
MYITAHRVTNCDGTTGVNCFYHKHQTVIGVNESWGGAEVSKITNHDPGVLFHQATELTPGGNFVLSYLDVICEDNTEPEDIKSALENFKHTVAVGQLWYQKKIVVYFSLTKGLTGYETLEYQALKTKILSTIPLIRSTSNKP